MLTGTSRKRDGCRLVVVSFFFLLVEKSLASSSPAT